MGILRTALREVKASIAKSEDHLKESWMREEEAHQEDRDWSDSSEGDVIVEGAEESGPTSTVATGPPILMASIQEAEPSIEVDVDDIPPLTSEDTTTVTLEEDEMLTGDPTSVAGEMARLQVTPPDSQKPKDGKTS